MPYDSNGNATIIRNRAVTGQTVQAAQVNTPFDDVQSMLSQVLLRSGVAPLTGSMNANGFKITNLPDASNPGDAVSLSFLTSFVSSINEKIADPWWQKPIGEPFPLVWGVNEVPRPPRDKQYKYVLLSAGQSGSGQYNEGILTSETVTGTSPNISATAVVNLSGSVFNGKTIRLINTERRFFRPGQPGLLQESQNLEHNHVLTDNGHRHNVTADGSPGGGGMPRIDNQGVSITKIFNDAITLAFTGITISPSGGDESRPRSIGADYYMRIL